MVRRAVASRDKVPSLNICLGCIFFLGIILIVQVSVLAGLLRRLAQLRAVAPPDAVLIEAPIALGAHKESSLLGIYDSGPPDAGLRGAKQAFSGVGNANPAEAHTALESVFNAGISVEDQVMAAPRQGKGLALGVAYGQGVDATLTFLTSLLRASSCSVVLFVDDGKLTPQVLQGVDIDLSRVKLEVRPSSELPMPWQSLDPTNFRYWLYLDYLQRSGSQMQYAHIQISDVRDVAFQKDPFDWVSMRHPGVHVFQEAQGAIIGQDSWKKKYIHECFGDPVLQRLAAQPSLNSGYMIGTSMEVIQFIQRFVTEQLAHLNCLKKGYDQGVHNVIIRGAPDLGISPLEAHVHIHLNRAGLVWTGTKVPRGKPQLDAQNNLLGQDGRPYAVLHQYDENEELWQILSDRLLGAKKKKLVLQVPDACALFDVGPGDLKGFDLSHMPATTQDDCCIGCIGDEACGAFIFSAAHKHCWLKVVDALSARQAEVAGSVQTLYGRKKM